MKEMFKTGSTLNEQPVLTSDSSLFRRLWLLTQGFRPHIIAVLLLEMLSAPLTLLSPIPLQVAVDSIIHRRPVPGPLRALLPASGADPRPLLIGVCVLSVLIAMLSQFQSLASGLLTTYTGQNLVLSLRARLFRHAQRLSLNYHTSKGTADALYRIQSDATAVEWIFIDGLIPLVSATFTLFAMLYVILRIDWKIGMIALVVSPILFLLTRLARPVLRRQSREVKRQESLAMGVVQEVMGILRVVKAFRQEDREQKRYTDQAVVCIRGRIRVNLIEGLLNLAINLVMAVGIGLVLYIGIGNVLSGALTLGMFLLILNYVTQLYSPLKTLSRKTVSMQSQFASMERAFDFLDLPPDVPERPDAKPLRRARGALSFHNVCFSYEKNRDILRNISFDVPPGARVGIAGPTGAGKTTLTHLMTRFDDPSSGQILLDNVDIRDYRLHDLRDQFAIVFQEPVLFSTSLADNIAYGCPGATREEIVDAAKCANIHETIMGLPDQYDTLVGERGLKLSGGERQRVGLARAFLKDAPILILDEPTSSIDVQTEAMIMDAMERLMQGRTTFMIAHRLNTLVHCDIMLRIEAGQLVEVKSPTPSDAALLPNA